MGLKRKKRAEERTWIFGQCLASKLAGGLLATVRFAWAALQE